MFIKHNFFFLSLISLVLLVQITVFTQENNQPLGRYARYSQHLTSTAFRQSTQIISIIGNTISTAIRNHPKLSLVAAGILVGYTALKYYKKQRINTQQLGRPGVITPFSAKFIRRNRVPLVPSEHASPLSNPSTGINGSIPDVQNPQEHATEIDRETGQLCCVGRKIAGNSYNDYVLAVVPLPGKKIPRQLSLNDNLCYYSRINKALSQETLNTYCIQYPRIRHMYELLRKGEPIRALITGRIFSGKSFLSTITAQQVETSHLSFFVSIIHLLSKWHNCQYAGMRDIILQALEINKRTGKKILLILNHIEYLEDTNTSPCCGVPNLSGHRALHKFFDNQERSDKESRAISIVGITDSPQELPADISERFFQPICLELPNDVMRSLIIRSVMQSSYHRFDDSVRQNVKTLVAMARGFNALDIENIFSSFKLCNFHTITWPTIETICTEIIQTKRK